MEKRKERGERERERVKPPTKEGKIRNEKGTIKGPAGERERERAGGVISINVRPIERVYLDGVIPALTVISWPRAALCIPALSGSVLPQWETAEWNFNPLENDFLPLLPPARSSVPRHRHRRFLARSPTSLVYGRLLFLVRGGFDPGPHPSGMRRDRWMIPLARRARSVSFINVALHYCHFTRKEWRSYSLLPASMELFTLTEIADRVMNHVVPMMMAKQSRSWSQIVNN